MTQLALPAEKAPADGGKRLAASGISSRAGAAGRQWTRRCAALAISCCIPLASAQGLPAQATARQPLPWTDPGFAAAIAEPVRQDRPHGEEDGRDLHVRRRTAGIMIGNALAVGLYGRRKWWQDGFDTDFRASSEGWFGQHTYSGGADKLGHFYFNYASARMFARAFEWAGNTREDALDLAAWLTLGTFTAVEVLDGFSKQWRFGKEDAIMNAAGVGAAYLLERNPRLDRLLDLRFLYRPSGNGSGFDPFGDYSGQTYLLVVKASGIPSMRKHGLLRYLEFAVGYGTRGYSSNPANSGDDRSRYVYAGLSVNLSEILDETVFRHSANARRMQGTANTLLEFIQVPGTAALARKKLGAD